MRRVSLGRRLYHRAVPERVRNPFGILRRRAQDRVTRFFTPIPLPPVELLRNIQLTPFVNEYLEVGRRSAGSIREALERSGVEPGARLLDFGCGSARTLRHLVHAGYELYGCDVDRAAIEWARRAIPTLVLEVTDERPPLPWPEASFDAAWAVSVFTHMPPQAQTAWFEELARVVKPHGVLVISTMGPSVLGAFVDHSNSRNREELERAGTIFRAREGAFNDQAAFHTAAGVSRLARPRFDLEEWQENGLDGFQDLSILRRR